MLRTLLKCWKSERNRIDFLDAGAKKSEAEFLGIDINEEAVALKLNFENSPFALRLKIFIRILKF
jgi:hypothetical protein